MKILRFNTTLKAQGKEYKQIVFWNRFLRNPVELILSWAPAIASIVLLALGKYSYFLLIIYSLCWAYPLYIFTFQFKNNVEYHLKHRDPSEDAPCTITFMDNAILAEIPDHDLIYSYEWNSFTTVYRKFGYYMFFNKGHMIVMLRIADMPEEMKKEIPAYIEEHVDRNLCKIAY